MYWKDQYVNVINTKNDKHTKSDNNVRVGQSDVRFKNQMFIFMDNVKNTNNHSSSMTNQINGLCDHSLPQCPQ